MNVSWLGKIKFHGLRRAFEGSLGELEGVAASSGFEVRLRCRGRAPLLRMRSSGHPKVAALPRRLRCSYRLTASRRRYPRVSFNASMTRSLIPYQRTPTRQDQADQRLGRAFRIYRLGRTIKVPMHRLTESECRRTSSRYPVELGVSG